MIRLEEIHRFDNIQRRVGGHDCWDIDMLFEGIVTGLAACAEQGKTPASIGIELRPKTWTR